jgi:hypothetical protein
VTTGEEVDGTRPQSECVRRRIFSPMPNASHITALLELGHSVQNPRQSEYLREELCVKFGLCLRRDAWERLLAEVPPDADSFARALLAADGLEPEPSHRRLYQQVRHHVEAALRRADAI